MSLSCNKYNDMKRNLRDMYATQRGLNIRDHKKTLKIYDIANYNIEMLLKLRPVIYDLYKNNRNIFDKLRNNKCHIPNIFDNKESFNLFCDKLQTIEWIELNLIIDKINLIDFKKQYIIKQILTKYRIIKKGGEAI